MVSEDRLPESSVDQRNVRNSGSHSSCCEDFYSNSEDMRRFSETYKTTPLFDNYADKDEKEVPESIEEKDPLTEIEDLNSAGQDEYFGDDCGNDSQERTLLDEYDDLMEEYVPNFEETIFNQEARDTATQDIEENRQGYLQGYQYWDGKDNVPAQDYAASGGLALASYKDSGSHGHVAVLTGVYGGDGSATMGNLNIFQTGAVYGEKLYSEGFNEKQSQFYIWITN